MDREDGMRAIHQIANCRPHAIAYDWAASSIVQDHAFDERLRAEIGISARRRRRLRPTASSAAWRPLGLKRVPAIFAYTEAVDKAGTGSAPRAVSRPSPARISASPTGSASPSRMPR
jgi:maleate cis-trans isomerase